MAEHSNEATRLAEARAAYSSAAAAKDVARMRSIAQTLLTLSPTLGTAQQIVATLPAELPNRPRIELRVAFLRSYTVETVIPFVKALARLHGLDLTVRVGEFNSYPQEIIDPSSWLYEFDPHIIFLAALTRDVAPDLWLGRQEASSDDAAAAAATAATVASRLTGLLDPLRSRSTASVILQNLEQPALPAAGILDAQREWGQAELIRAINRQLQLQSARHEGVYVLDYDGLIARHGRQRWHDERKWLTSRAPVAADCLILAAQEYLRFIVPLSGRQAKVLAVDLDNTLWGGVVGEEGVDGIKIGAEYPGASFLALQRVILDLAERGVLLAVCSKNNPADALEALDHRSEMLLRSKHFAAMRINWVDKAENLRDIAQELNVGIDSIAFLDDNPVERQRVQLAIPEVTVVELPEDPSGYAAALQSCPVFERLKITAEDRDRGRYYVEQRERKQSEAAAGSLEDFYRSLQMKAEIIAVTPATIARIAQLTQKTNQLNTTTRRYTESDVQGMAKDPAWDLFGIRIVDKFGDNGIVGVVFTRAEGDVAEIDTFLLSCRVIGRTVETAMLAQICKLAAARGCRRVGGWFLPTKKNSPAANIYSGHGFVATRTTESGVYWELNLRERLIETPEWIA